MEEQIEECKPKTGDDRVSCWAEVDRELMDSVVPWVPYLLDNDVGRPCCFSERSAWLDDCRNDVNTRAALSRGTPGRAFCAWPVCGCSSDRGRCAGSGHQ